MIATNFRKHPDAMALQLPLPFGRTLKWALPRPGSRVLRAIRVSRGTAFKQAGRIKYAIKDVVPQWFRDAAKAAQELAKQVRDACMPIAFLATGVN